MAELSLPDLLLMGFDKRLVNLRKERGLTQQALAEKAEMHVVQIRRYETNASQPSIEAIKKLATALAVRGHQTFFAGREADRQGRAGESDPQARRAALHPDVLTRHTNSDSRSKNPANGWGWGEAFSG